MIDIPRSSRRHRLLATLFVVSFAGCAVDDGDVGPEGGDQQDATGDGTDILASTLHAQAQGSAADELFAAMPKGTVDEKGRERRTIDDIVCFGPSRSLCFIDPKNGVVQVGNNLTSGTLFVERQPNACAKAKQSAKLLQCTPKGQLVLDKLSNVNYSLRDGDSFTFLGATAETLSALEDKSSAKPTSFECTAGACTFLRNIHIEYDYANKELRVLLMGETAQDLWDVLGAEAQTPDGTRSAGPDVGGLPAIDCFLSEGKPLCGVSQNRESICGPAPTADPNGNCHDDASGKFIPRACCG